MSNWNNTLPTNQVFSVTSNGANNASGQTYMAYCFTNITGYSHFGTYKGNGSSSNAPFVGGTFVYTGFKPALIIGKYRDGTGDWYLWDSKRLGYNRDNNKIKPITTNIKKDNLATIVFDSKNSFVPDTNLLFLNCETTPNAL